MPWIYARRIREKLKPMTPCKLTANEALVARDRKCPPPADGVHGVMVASTWS